MRKKRIVQYCCAVLVAAGIGLNIQNAIADYGMNRNTMSLVAECITYATGGTLGWCSYVNQSNIYYHTSSGTDSNGNTWCYGHEVEKEGTIDQCCDKSGRWRVVFWRFPSGEEKYLRGTKLTFQRWVSYSGRPTVVTNPDGSQTVIREHWRVCKERGGDLSSDCPYAEGIQELGYY